MRKNKILEKTAVFDIEASDWVNFKILGFYDGDEFKTFDSVPGFLEYVLRKKYRGFKFYAHYAGRYDFLFLLEYLFNQHDLKVKIIEGGSRIIQIKVERDKHCWFFNDSYALLPAKLKDLCDGFKTKHRKLDFNVADEKNFTSEAALEYLKNDCLGLYEVLEYYHAWGKNRGKLKLTAAQQALYIYRKDYLKDNLEQLSEDKEDFIRHCYYGGRCEIFKLYGEDLFYYDVNSMYPYVMLKNMPVGKALSSSRYEPGKIGFYKIRVNFPYSKIPYIPVVVERKLLFPYGNFCAYVSSVEIEELIKDKIPFEINQGIVFSSQSRLFADYVHDFYNLKEKAAKGSADYIISKCALNNLYGKFGQRRNREEIIKTSDVDDIIGGRLRPYFEALDLYKKQTSSRSSFILPHLAAYITSLARMELYRLFSRVGFDNVFYCDTDSVITSKALSTSSALGDIKEEYRIKRAAFIQPKVYLMETDKGKILKMKGFQNPDFEIDDFLSAINTGDISKLSCNYSRMAGFKESLIRFKDVKVRRINNPKQLKSLYNKRQLINNYNTEPLLINN